MNVLNGQVVGAAGSIFRGHRVLLSYMDVLLEGTEGRRAEPPVLAPAERGAGLATDGAFSLGTLDVDRVARPVTIAVFGPSGTELARRTLDTGDLRERIVVNAEPEPTVEIEESEDEAPGRVLRLTGRVVDGKGRRVPAGLPVVILGVPADDVRPDPPPVALLVTDTQAGGHLAGDWRPDILRRAFATVRGVTSAPIGLDARQRLPRRVLIVLDLPDDVFDVECECGTAPPRAPDPLDLVANPAAFAQDLGGGCVELNTPNRTIEEYSYFLVVRTSEPEIRHVPATPSKPLPPGLVRDFVSAFGPDQLTRARVASGVGGQPDRGALPELSAATASRLLKSGSAFALEEIADAELVTRIGEAVSAIKQVVQAEAGRTDLDGNHSIDWDDTPRLAQAITVAHGHLLQYRQVWRADGYSLGDLLYSLPLAPGQQRRVAVVDWDRRTRSERTEALEFEEHLEAFLGRDRDVSEIVGSSLSEEIAGGSRATHWGVAGGIGAGFIGSGFGIFGGVSGGASGSSASSWQDAARSFGASSLQQLQDRTTQRASAVRDERATVIQMVAQGESVRAETEVVANYNHCHAITVEYFEVLRHFLVTHELADVRECLFVPLPMVPFDARKAKRWREMLSRHLRDRRLLPGFDAIERVMTNWDGWDYPTQRFSEEAPEVLEGELRVSFVLPRPRDGEDEEYLKTEWLWTSPLVNGPTIELWTKHLAARDQAARDAYFREHVAPGIAEQFVQRLTFAYITREGLRVNVPLDATLVSRYVEGAPLYVSLRPAGALPNIPRDRIARFEIAYTAFELPVEARVIVHSGRVRYRTTHLSHLLFDSPSMLNDLRGGDPAIASTPLSREELRNPRQEDIALAGRLVDHLNDHLEGYHQAMWAEVNENHRFLLLDGVEAPNADGRSVASVVENRLIGIAGNSLILPVAPGMHLDPTLEPIEIEGEPPQPPPLLDAYASDVPPPMRISVPTRGVYAEAIQGKCSSCEPIDDTRFWRWEEALPPLRPNELGPVSVASRAETAADVKPTPLPQPIINIQQAPALPDPFGLRGAIELLGKNVFADATGLEGTQKAALGAFKSALNTATAMAEQATALAKQNELARAADRALEQIQSAKAADLLSPEQASELTRGALSKLVGQPADNEKAPTASKTVEKALEAATQAERADVSVSTPTEKIEASFDGGAAAPAVGTGAGTAPAVQPSAALDLPHALALPFVFDQLVFLSPSWRYPGAPTASDLVTHPKIAPWVARHMIPEDPARPGHVLIPTMLRIVFPEAPGAPGVVAGAGRLPLVVLVHGQHMAWHNVAAGAVSVIPNHVGYDYLQEELARQQIISVSVDTNAANALDLAVETRADLVLEAVRQVLALNGSQASPLFERVDPARIGLMGHSRGGDAVVRAARKNREPGGPNFGIEAVCSLAPTDLTFSTTDPLRLVRLQPRDTGFYCVLYGSLDGDVAGRDGATGAGGTGFRHYDRAEVPRAMVFLRGCGHNRFNTTWAHESRTGSFMGDESGVLPSQAAPGGALRSHQQHRQLASEYICGLFAWRLNGQAARARLFNGTGTNSLGVPVSLQWSHGRDVIELDDCEHPVNLPVGGTRVLRFGAHRDFGDAVTRGIVLNFCVPHNTSIIHLPLESVTTPPASDVAIELLLPQTTVRDWSSHDLLTFRIGGWYDVALDAAGLAARPRPRSGITLIYEDGRSERVDDARYTNSALPTRPFVHDYFLGLDAAGNERSTRVTLLRIETLRVPLALFTVVRTARVARVLIHMDRANRTDVFLDSFALVRS